MWPSKLSGLQSAYSLVSMIKMLESCCLELQPQVVFLASVPTSSIELLVPKYVVKDKRSRCFCSRRAEMADFDRFFSQSFSLFCGFRISRCGLQRLFWYACNARPEAGSISPSARHLENFIRVDPRPVHPAASTWRIWPRRQKRLEARPYLDTDMPWTCLDCEKNAPSIGRRLVKIQCWWALQLLSDLWGDKRARLALQRKKLVGTLGTSF